MKRKHFEQHAAAIDAAARAGLESVKTGKPAKPLSPDQETRNAIDAAVRAGLKALRRPQP